MEKYSCLDCIHFKYKETVVDGRIEHKLPDGRVWMTEPKYKEIPMHCPLHKEYFEEWWEKNKTLRRTDEEYQGPDCKDFDLPEHAKILKEMIGLAQKIIDKK